MNLLLMREGYPPAVVRSEDRVAYYDALDAARTGKTGGFVRLIGEAVERSLDMYLEAVPRIG